jgi:TPR repeat protein
VLSVGVREFAEVWEATVSRYTPRLCSCLAAAILVVFLRVDWDCSAAPLRQEEGSVLPSAIQSRAASGDADAQFQLALYLLQNSHPTDHASILTLVRASASQAYAPAQCLLGYLYQEGLGVPRDYAKAAENYRAAALQGYTTAENNLANLYQAGLGVPRSLGTAFAWYHSSAEHGDAVGERNLGALYYRGLGTHRDFREAIKWFRAAADHGDPQAEHDLGFLYYKGLGVPLDYTMAAHWEDLAARQGEPNAEADLGFLYESGEGVALDYVAAYVWYARARASGVKLADQRCRSLDHLLTAKQLQQANSVLAADSSRPKQRQPFPPASADAFVVVQNH